MSVRIGLLFLCIFKHDFPFIRRRGYLPIIEIDSYVTCKVRDPNFVESLPAGIDNTCRTVTHR